MRTLGIDLAAKDKTAACIIDWRAHEALVSKSEAGTGSREDIEWLVALVCPVIGPTPDAVGVDAPFGWPVEMLDGITAWAARMSWPAVSKSGFRFRQTDRRVREETGRWPLSVSSDRIAITTLRCVRLLHGIAHARSLGGPLSRVGKDRVFEVYPGAALTRWKLNRVGSRRAAMRRSGALNERPVRTYSMSCREEPGGSTWTRRGRLRKTATMPSTR